jgi:hypothetical protein
MGKNMILQKWAMKFHRRRMECKQFARALPLVLLAWFMPGPVGLAEEAATNAVFQVYPVGLADLESVTEAVRGFVGESGHAMCALKSILNPREQGVNLKLRFRAPEILRMKKASWGAR